LQRGVPTGFPAFRQHTHAQAHGQAQAHTRKKTLNWVFDRDYILEGRSVCFDVRAHSFERRRRRRRRRRKRRRRKSHVWTVLS